MFSNFKYKRIDTYITKKFLGTFFYSIALIIIIVIIFDISEKIDDFLEKNAPLSEIIFTYYLNFVPYFVNLFSPLFTFIAVIYFTSKLANNTEIIAVLSSGISYYRLLRPFIYSAVFLSCKITWARGLNCTPGSSKLLILYFYEVNCPMFAYRANKILR